jgi:hypothetical protein
LVLCWVIVVELYKAHEDSKCCTVEKSEARNIIGRLLVEL